MPNVNVVVKIWKCILFGLILVPESLEDIMCAHVVHVIGERQSTLSY